MDGKIIAFRISKLKGRRAVKFCRELYGYKDKSYYGRYEYDRPGLLNDIPHAKLIRGVIIVRKQDAGKIVNLLKKFNAEYYVRLVELTKSDKRILRK